LNSVLRIILQRLGLGLLTLLVVSIVIFVAVNMLPGDFAQLILGQGATPESVASIRRDLGLDQPLVVRYFQWLGGMVTGDLGTPCGCDGCDCCANRCDLGDFGSALPQYGF